MQNSQLLNIYLISGKNWRKPRWLSLIILLIDQEICINSVLAFFQARQRTTQKQLESLKWS